MLVLPGGTAIAPTIDTSGTVDIFAGGEVIFSGGDSPSIAPQSGAIIELISGSYAVPPFPIEFVTNILASGGTGGAATLISATAIISAGGSGLGGTASAGTTIVGSGGYLSGGTALGGEVSFVKAGGLVVGGTIESGAVTTVWPAVPMSAPRCQPAVRSLLNPAPI